MGYDVCHGPFVFQQFPLCSTCFSTCVFPPCLSTIIWGVLKFCCTCKRVTINIFSQITRKWIHSVSFLLVMCCCVVATCKLLKYFRQRLECSLHKFLIVLPSSSYHIHIGCDLYKNNVKIDAVLFKNVS